MKLKSEINLMAAETQLDRAQALLAKGETYRAKLEIQKALGQIRTALQYHQRNRQKTLLPHMDIHPSGLRFTVVTHQTTKKVVEWVE